MLEVKPNLLNTNLDVLGDFLDNSALDGGFAQDVVWGNARLTTVDELSPSDTTGTSEREH